MTTTLKLSGMKLWFLSASLAWPQQPVQPPTPTSPSESQMGGETGEVAPGEPVYEVNPQYPKKARKQKVEGPVVLRVTIGVDGNVKNVTAARGDSRLTSAALEAVQQWRFHPRIENGKSIEFERDVTVTFSLAADPAGTQKTESNERTFEPGVGVSPPSITYSTEPEYSKAAKDARVGGVVVLNLIVGTDGNPYDIKIARTLGHGLDDKAIEAVRHWRFKPAIKAGKPVAVLTNVEVAFNPYR